MTNTLPIGSKNYSLSSPEIHSFILENYGIDADVKYIDGKPAIKVNNHLSMFSIVSKIRADFSFTIYHQAKTNEYIIYLQ
jgi:hypothetical protein